MDNPAASTRSSIFGGFKKRKPRKASRVSGTTDSTGMDTDDDGASMISQQTSSSRSSKSSHHQQGSSPFSGPMAMTSLELQLPKRRTLRSHNDEVKESYRMAAEGWQLIKMLNKNVKANDPLTYAPTRLGSFLQFYDSILLKSQVTPKVFQEQETLGAFWSIQAFKFLTGVDAHFSFDVLADFFNITNSKSSKKLKIVAFSNECYVHTHNWQLALDNPKCEIYCYTLTPVLYTQIPDYKQAIGPPNHHIIFGDSYTSVPLAQESFVGAVCYDLFLYLQETDWVPVLSEVHRLLLPHGQLNLMLMDFTILNSKSEIYNNFFKMLQDVMKREGLDPFPAKTIQKKLKDAGFERVRYTFVTLKKGIPTKMGNLMEFVQSYWESMIFRHVAQRNLTDEELKQFEQTRVQYNKDSRDGNLMDEFGDWYFMILFAEKTGAPIVL